MHAEPTNLTKVAQWAGAAFGLIGASMLALNLPFSGWAYVLFIVSDICWISIGLWKRIPGLVTQHLIFLGINGVGIYRWLL